MKKKYKLLAGVLILSSIFTIKTAVAQVPLLGKHNAFKQKDTTAYNDKICQDLITDAEKQYHIPKDVLFALALLNNDLHTKSNKGLGTLWPWTVTTVEKTMHLKSKNSMLIKVIENIENGQGYMYIGCMQLNLHNRNLYKVKSAIEPQATINFAAKRIYNLFLVHKRWNQAIRYFLSTDLRQQKLMYDKFFQILSDLKNQKLEDELNKLYPNVSKDNPPKSIDDIPKRLFPTKPMKNIHNGHGFDQMKLLNQSFKIKTAKEKAKKIKLNKGQ